MKTSSLSAVMAAIAIFWLAPGAGATRIPPAESSCSDCKGNDTRSTRAASGSPYGEEDPGLVWDMEYSGGCLSVRWTDYEGNCCPEYLEGALDIEGNTITIYVDEGVGICDCLCLYDLEAVYDDIAPGHYRLVFRHGYRESTTVEADLQEGFRGVFKAGDSSVVGDVADGEGCMSVAEGELLCVTHAGAFTLSVYDAAGVCRFGLQAVDAAEVVLSTLPAGVYVARMSAADGKTATLTFVR